MYTRGSIPLLRIHHCIEQIRTDSERYVGVPVTRLLYYDTGGHLHFAWDEREMHALGERILRIMSDPALLQEHVERMRAAARDAIRAAEATLRLDLRTHPDEILITLFHEMVRQETPAQAWMNPEIDAVDIFPAEHVKERVFAAVPEQERMRAFAKLTAPAYMSYVAKERIALLEILAKKRDEGSASDEMLHELQAIQEEFWWTSLGWESLKLKTVDDFLYELEECDRTIENPAATIASLREMPQITLRERDSLVRRYGIPKETVQLINAFETYTELHDIRKEMQVKTFYCIYALMREAARRIGADPLDMEWFTIDEACAFLRERRFPAEEAARRRKATFMLLSDGKIAISSGDDAVALAKTQLESVDSDSSALKGMGASHGIARGIARVCSGAKDALAKVREGDVLVCGMTLPDYVPAMRKACAIVTDEGGITCHAAIMSRELKKPCVIGTKRATRTLKDGDFVEVDADRGTVTIVTRK